MYCLKGGKMMNRKIIVIAIIIILIAVGLSGCNDNNEEVNFLTVEEITQNKQKYVNKDVIVKGYYEKGIAGFEVVASILSTTEGKKEIELNLDKLRETYKTDNLRAGNIYYFTGVIIEINNPVTPGIDIMLMVENFERV